MVLKYSYNTKINETTGKFEANRTPYGYTTGEIPWSEPEIKELLTTRSISPNKFKTGHRVRDDFESYQHIMLDFDDPNNISPQQMVEKIKGLMPNVAFVVFSSINHQKFYNKGGKGYKHDKYRVLFPLAEPVQAYTLETKIKPYFLTNFHLLDQTCFDIARYFYKGTDQFFHFETGSQYFNPYTIDPKILKKQKKTPNRIHNVPEDLATPHIKLDQDIKTEHNTIVKLRNIKQKTIVYCPFHEDTTASAFIDHKVDSTPFLFCSTCKSKKQGTNATKHPGSFYLTYNERAQNFSAPPVFLSITDGCAVSMELNYEGKITKYELKTADNWLNYCKKHGLDPKIKEDLPRYEIVYTPAEPHGAHPSKDIFNTYRHSELFDSELVFDAVHHTDPDLGRLKTSTPFLYTVLTNLCGTTEYTHWYVNWVAALLQGGKSPITCPIFQNATTGIGKDLFGDRVLKEIFGKENHIKGGGDSIAERFSGHLARKRIVIFNELFESKEDDKFSQESNDKRLQWLKNRIGANTQIVEAKGKDKIEMEHYAGYILQSNNVNSLLIEEDDRRFVVFENHDAQKITEHPELKRILKTNNPIDADIEEKINEELPVFAKYLQTFQVDTRLYSTALETEAKKRMQNANIDPYKEFVEALRNADLDYFELDLVLSKYYDKRASKYDKLGVNTDMFIGTETEFISYFITNYASFPNEYAEAIIMHKFMVQEYNKSKPIKELRKYNFKRGLAGVKYPKTRYDQPSKQYRRWGLTEK